MRGIFRSGDPTCLGHADSLGVFCAAGVAVFFDLRSEDERLSQGAAAGLEAAGILCRSVPIRHRSPALAVARPGPLGYLRAYLDLLDEAAGDLRNVLRAFLDLDGKAFAFGCHAGKDRTGAVAALLLHMAGAPRREIVADYARSADFLLPRLDDFRAHWHRRGLTADDYASRLDARAETMAAFLDAVDERWNGLDSLLAGLGVTGADRGRFRCSYSPMDGA